MDVLVEVHDRSELDIALELDTTLLGINNRNLRTFETSLQNTITLLPTVPENKRVITDSGILTPDDVALMREHQVHAFLVDDRQHGVKGKRVSVGVVLGGGSTIKKK